MAGVVYYKFNYISKGSIVVMFEEVQVGLIDWALMMPRGANPLPCCMPNLFLNTRRDAMTPPPNIKYLVNRTGREIDAMHDCPNEL